MSLIRNFFKASTRCRRMFMVNMLWKGWLGIRKFNKRKERGEMFPAFQFISVTNDCNLKCQGCWVSGNAQKDNLDIASIDAIIDSGKKKSSYFYGLLGGEPLMYKPLFDIFRKHSDCYFLLFTNGTLFTESTARELAGLGNVMPLFSFEGDELGADIRRGGKNIYRRTLQSIDNSVKEGLLTGAAISVCKSNIEMSLSESFIQMLHDHGVLYLWYYIYRPAGENPNYELALSSEEILRLRRFLVNYRPKSPVVLIDSYWNAKGEPFCPAAEGMSHHINAAGFIEPCPVIQYSLDRINGQDLRRQYEDSVFLRSFKEEIQQKTRGCVLMEDPAWLSSFAERHSAINTSNRPGMTSALLRAPVVSSHGSCPVIPEKSFLYKFAKRTAFFGMGAYG